MAKSSLGSNSDSLGPYIGRAGLTVWLKAKTCVSPCSIDKYLVRYFYLGSISEYQTGCDAIIR